jgi:ribosomal protein L7/L12
MENSFDERRIARLEQQVDFLFRHLGIDPAAAADQQGLPPTFYDAVRAGNKAGAMKIYRAVTGASLADAKRAVDETARRGGR